MPPHHTRPSLDPDCASCAALCCVVFAFDRSESFAYDKGAGEVCKNLAPDNTCKIFEKRSALGYQGCITYNCYGAGQRVTQEVFNGRSWRDDKALLTPMGEALSVLRRIHEQLMLLRAATGLPLSESEKEVLYRLEGRLTPEAAWTQDALAGYPIDTVCRDVAVFLKQLQRHV
ncbi:hypothetical protein E1180_20685 [Roseibium denhamense]|uniref:Pentapeptide repeat-containing protein n=1 Tax=Roseibium denhamense TaxID=76305 RepID=A0ABY1NR76_9HYPH|nr:hypothetical protein [Roseibium denhamense]MTI07922.1 hypothetical protein [Roseibium denhamense]SMP14949.1 hypothetical protein SAMN06265374_1504 [Roseibium denhamense]